MSLTCDAVKDGSATDELVTEDPAEAGPENVLFEVVEELHETGESMIPLYLFLHVGAVILHTISGNSVWKRMFSFTRG